MKMEGREKEHYKEKRNDELLRLSRSAIRRGGSADNSMCACELENETGNHISCLSYFNLRVTILGNSILTPQDIKELRAINLNRFLRKTGNFSNNQNQNIGWSWTRDEKTWVPVKAVPYLILRTLIRDYYTNLYSRRRLACTTCKLTKELITGSNRNETNRHSVW